jgi:hypothetical protein
MITPAVTGTIPGSVAVGVILAGAGIAATIGVVSNSLISI